MRAVGVLVSVEKWAALVFMAPVLYFVFLLIVAEQDRRHQERWKRVLTGRAEDAARERGRRDPAE